MLFSMGCVPTITCPTRHSCDSSTLIAHICTNNLSKSIRSYVLLTDVSDHLPTKALGSMRTYDELMILQTQ